MWLVDAWYRGAWWLNLLRPLSALFVLLARRRRQKSGAQARPVDIPVIVVGNITVGGTGKTPVVLALAEALQRSGLRVGVLSRGYGGCAAQYPLRVTSDTPVKQCGDEASLMRRHLHGPLVLDPQRAHALHALVKSGECDVVLSDDGLQHHRLWRDVEIAVIDADRGLGNGLCLPAGPLREPPSRLAELDHIVLNGHMTQSSLSQWQALAGTTPVSGMSLRAREWVNVKTGQRVALQQFFMALGLDDSTELADDTTSAGQAGSEQLSLHAIAGIGHPQRFFDTLQTLGLNPLCRAFPDHHNFVAEDLAFAGKQPLLMTEKDAVKCHSFAGDNWWYLSVTAQLSPSLLKALATKIDAIRASANHQRD
ncbi:tetraacyldisaccharide 4'-kinase [Pseudohongiella spirulinae]|uniref:Tetraacyldisaccharide 4'-kinase n=1 Tax=Pseudohongiella spirulinae TaxID=1249552 RepID=A0A0S2KES3_9GAMM|nr:tetraacyldisaccharide 4'-kinase [Pseudohongiella spirulinae]ALO46463.1 Tetraacyldisaccharide 4'-kinase [Pseudohongiella spirulinae]